MCLINKLLFGVNLRHDGRNTFTIFTTVLIIATTYVTNISGEHISASQLCCSIKKFTCNNETSPLEIQCGNKTDHRSLLIPDIYPEDKFTIVQTGNDNKTKMLVTEDYNYNEPEFCLGWSTIDNKTHEVALVCNSFFDFYEEDDQIFGLLQYISGLCLLCSVIFAFITLVIYLMLPWLRDLQGKIIMSLLISICIGYSTLSFIQIIFDFQGTMCIISGFMVYYWCFATFTWLHMSCFNIWRTVVLSQSNYKIFQDPKRLFIIYSLFAWGVPALFVIVALLIEFTKLDILNHIRPRIGESRCWFHSRKAIWTFFYGPLLIIILINILYFISVVKRLHKIEKQQLKKKASSAGNADVTKSSELAKKSIRKLKNLNKMIYKNKLYLKLFFAMGITFIFEILSDLYSYHMQYSLLPRIIFQATDIINALQGLILFIVLVLTRRKVLEGVFNKLSIPNKYLPFKNEDKDREDEEGEGDEDDEAEDFATVDDEQNLTTSNVNNQQLRQVKITEAIQMA